METIGILVAVIIAIVGLTIYSALSWGLVMFKFYTWFILPVFITLPEITYLQAVGLALFATLLKTHVVDTIKDEYKDKNKAWIDMIYPWMSLFLGWLIYVWFIQ